ncbi:SP_1767 family glycosyltransferase [Streptococcus marmotae]|uniref:SP_1767 family glycosyltransferase n=1 Tax=Streptococcus marmotae TaxID=1825069 RepID=UPI00082CF4B2|nr:SP_1767 family glycosyltransferase [Streptococcus marmotae]
MKELVLHVRNNRESLAFIKQHRVSVARFGDGEIDVIAGASIPYQDYTPELANTLRTILAYQSDENFLVCLPDVFERQERYNAFCRQFWDQHLQHYQALYQEICTADWYGSTFLSRPYIDLEDKSTVGDYFSQLRGLWEGQDILIVEGETSRSGVGNDLFTNCRSVERIICPSRNAYSHYQWIRQQIVQHGKEKLILLMLGPTAKALSWELSKEGLWLVDLGHIDSEYEWYKMGATSKVKLPHKHTAEFNFDTDITFADDVYYIKQIVADYRRNPETPLVSILVAVQNDEKYVEECLNSIFQQKYQQLEVLVVDIGSTDGSSVICKQFADRDQRLRYIRYENTAMSEALTTSLQTATGDYVALFLAKDILRDDFLSVLLEKLWETNADIAIGNYITYSETNQVFHYYVLDKDFCIEKLSPQEAINRQSQWQFNTLCFQMPWGKLYKRQLFEHFIYPGNHDLVSHKLYLQSQSIVFVNKDYYVYREIPQSEQIDVPALLAIWNEKLADLVLASCDLTITLQHFRWLLGIWKKELEEKGQETGATYQLLEQKLDFLQKAETK